MVFDSPAEEPFRYGNVSWARNGGCQCSCANMAACAAEGRAPAWGMGLVAQHTCREQVDRVPVWHQVRSVLSHFDLNMSLGSRAPWTPEAKTTAS